MPESLGKSNSEHKDDIVSNVSFLEEQGCIIYPTISERSIELNKKISKIEESLELLSQVIAEHPDKNLANDIGLLKAYLEKPIIDKPLEPLEHIQRGVWRDSLEEINPEAYKYFKKSKLRMNAFTAIILLIGNLKKESERSGDERLSEVVGKILDERISPLKENLKDYEKITTNEQLSLVYQCEEVVLDTLQGIISTLNYKTTRPSF